MKKKGFSTYLFKKFIQEFKSIKSNFGNLNWPEYLDIRVKANSVLGGKGYESATKGIAEFLSGQKLPKEFNNQSVISPIQPSGELARLYRYGSDSTDLQREYKLKEIKNKWVLWKHVVYEVSRDRNHYIIQLSGRGGVNAYVYIPRDRLNQRDKKRIREFKTGSQIYFLGNIKEMTFPRHLKIEPAVLFEF